MYKFSILFLILSLSFISGAEEITYLWEVALPGNVIGTPIERKRNELILICEDRRLYSLNSKTGSINWKVKPGGRLEFLEISTDGSIIVKSRESVYSYYGDGSLRWSIDISDGITGSLSLNIKGDIFFVSDKSIKCIDRYGRIKTVLEGINSDNVVSLKNSLLLYSSGSKVIAVTLSGKSAWEYDLDFAAQILKSKDETIYIISKSGDIVELDLYGNLIEHLSTEFNNIDSASFNYNKNLILVNGSQRALISDGIVTKVNEESIEGLYYSNGLLIKSKKDWTLHGVYINSGYEYFPSGKIQLFERDITLAHKRVWGDEQLLEYYYDAVFSGDRAIQEKILKEIEENLLKEDLLDLIPNFYQILLLASSAENKNQDIRMEAYRLIGLSRDLSFLPYLVNDLDGEKSYVVMPYIFYAISMIGVDLNGGVISVINSRIDDYYDEKLVINALYALYNINQYTNGEFVGNVFTGIEKILDGGYSRKIENQCYDIIQKIK